MPELEEIRWRLTEVEAALVSGGNDLYWAFGGAAVGAVIAAIVSYVVYRLQRTNTKHQYHLEKLEDLSRDLENIRVMFATFEGEIEGGQEHTGPALTNPRYTDFIAVPKNLGFEELFNIPLDKIIASSKGLIKAGVVLFRNNEKVSPEFTQAKKILHEDINKAQVATAKAMKQLVKKF